MTTKCAFLKRFVDMACLHLVECEDGSFRAERGELNPEELLKLVFQEMQARIDYLGNQPASYEQVFWQFQRELFGGIVTKKSARSCAGR